MMGIATFVAYIVLAVLTATLVVVGWGSVLVGSVTYFFDLSWILSAKIVAVVIGLQFAGQITRRRFTEWLNEKKNTDNTNTDDSE